VIEKNRSNFCDFFTFREAGAEVKGNHAGDSVKTKIASLFKAK
jgi:hypothetical protein